MTKKSPKVKTHRVLDMWKAYAEKLLADNPDWYGKRTRSYGGVPNYYIYNNEAQEMMSYATFKQILEVYFSEAKEVIIAGQGVNLGNNLGVIEARRVERNFKLKIIDWGATNKQPKDENGKPIKLIYHTDEDWCRIGWIKHTKIYGLPEASVYKFVPTPDDGTGKGFVREFVTALQRNPALKYKYRYYPYVIES